MVTTPLAAFAQGAAPPTDLHRYPLPTYEEDWRALQGVDRTDVWDPVKFVPLSADGITSLSLGGEARVTYERFGNQAFVDVTVGVTGPSAAVLRVGRQEIALGAGRMHALREGPNVPLSFDGVRAIAHAGPWRLDGWAARPVDNTPGVFDDRSHHSFDVWGVYGSRVITLSRQRVGLDVYYLGLARDAAQFEQGTAKETRHTFGARVWHQGAWAYDAEAMFQIGRFGSGDIRAWRSMIEGSHLVADAVWLPRLGLVLDVASGDKNPADPNLQTFNALFQSGTYSGRAQLLGPSNSIRVEPTVTLAPARQVL